jgi:large subunit ribosomal protein L10
MSNAKILESKKTIVANIKEKFEKAQTVVLVDYRGLTVAEDTELRNQLRQAGVEYCVLKNTMINLATKEMGFDQLAAHLEGPTAVAFGYEDMIAPAKILSDFSKAKKKMTIKCGICDGAYLDQAGVAALANLPSKEVLIAKIMGSMMSSVSKFVYCVEALRKKQAGEE